MIQTTIRGPWPTYHRPARERHKCGPTYNTAYMSGRIRAYLASNPWLSSQDIAIVFKANRRSVDTVCREMVERGDLVRESLPSAHSTKWCWHYAQKGAV